jgi:hypothetical protein
MRPHALAPAFRGNVIRLPLRKYPECPQAHALPASTYNAGMAALPSALDRELAALLGDAWLRDDSERLAYAYDNSRKLAVPDAVALPTSRRCRS